MNTYTVLDQGEPIATGLISHKAAELIGIDQKAVLYYSRTKRPYLDRYSFVVDGQIDGNEIYQLPGRLNQEWDNMMQAAKLLKSGKGRIVTRNGKKYVEVI